MTVAGVEPDERGDAEDRVELWRAVVDAWRRVTRDSERNLARVGMSLAVLRILKTLHNEGPVPMAALSSETMLTQPAITATVDRLERKGLVRRLRSREDRRVINIGITAKGEALYARGIGAHRRFVKDSLQALSDGEVSALASTLRKVADSSDALVG